MAANKRKWSFYLGTIAKTDLYVHWTFLFLVFFVFFSSYGEGQSWSQAALSLVFILVLFACVVLHEFGHITVARRYGCTAKKITLYPVGGVAYMDSMPEKPMQEFWMAIAGPWVNVVIAAFLFLGIWITKGVPALEKIDILTTSNFLYNLMVYNLALAIFNLAPAFPMDGGRILRSLLSLRYSREKATSIAVRVGQIVAAVFVLTGFFLNTFLLLIGVLIFFAGGQELTIEITKGILKGFKVKDAVMHRYVSLSPNDSLAHLVKLMLNGQEKEFLVVENGIVKGIISGDDVVKGLQEHGEHTPVSRIMNPHFVSLDANLLLTEAFNRVAAAEQHIFPVLDGDTLTGIIDLHNITEFGMVRRVEENRKSATLKFHPAH